MACRIGLALALLAAATFAVLIASHYAGGA